MQRLEEESNPQLRPPQDETPRILSVSTTLDKDRSLSSKAARFLFFLIVLLVVDGDSSIEIISSRCRGLGGGTCLPLGSVCFDQVGVHLSTVSAQNGGKCSSNIVRYQYLSFMLAKAQNLRPENLRFLRIWDITAPLRLGVLHHLIRNLKLGVVL